MDGVRFIGEFAARGYRPELIVISSHEFSVLHSVRLMAETYGLVVPGIWKSADGGFVAQATHWVI